MDRVEFNNMCQAYESTIKANPVLSRSEEAFIFTKIQQYRSKIIELAISTESIFSHIKEVANQHLTDKIVHEFFAMPSFSSKDEYNEILDSKRRSLVAICNSESFVDVRNIIRTNGVNFQIFESVIDKLSQLETDNEAVSYIRIFTELKNFYIDKIVNSNLKLLIKSVSKYKGDGTLTCEDMFSEAFFGLHRAINLFDINRGNKFSTYATQWIFSTIRRANDNHSNLVHIPVNVSEQRREIERIKNKFINEFGRMPTRDEVIERMRKHPVFEDAVDYNFTFNSIEDTTSGDDSNSRYDNSIMDSRICDEIDIATISEVRNVLDEYITNLKSHKEQYYIRYAFGYNDAYEVKSKDEIISDLNITHSEYEVVRKSAMKKMKDTLSYSRVLSEGIKLESGWNSFFNSRS